MFYTLELEWHPIGMSVKSQVKDESVLWHSYKRVGQLKFEYIISRIYCLQCVYHTDCVIKFCLICESFDIQAFPQANLNMLDLS